MPNPLNTDEQLEQILYQLRSGLNTEIDQDVAKAKAAINAKFDEAVDFCRRDPNATSDPILKQQIIYNNFLRDVIKRVWYGAREG